MERKKSTFLDMFRRSIDESNRRKVLNSGEFNADFIERQLDPRCVKSMPLFLASRPLIKAEPLDSYPKIRYDRPGTDGMLKDLFLFIMQKYHLRIIMSEEEGRKSLKTQTRTSRQSIFVGMEQEFPFAFLNDSNTRSILSKVVNKAIREIFHRRRSRRLESDFLVTKPPLQIKKSTSFDECQFFKNDLKMGLPEVPNILLVQKSEERISLDENQAKKRPVQKRYVRRESTIINSSILKSNPNNLTGLSFGELKFPQNLKHFPQRQNTSFFLRSSKNGFSKENSGTDNIEILKELNDKPVLSKISQKESSKNIQILNVPKTERLVYRRKSNEIQKEGGRSRKMRFKANDLSQMEVLYLWKSRLHLQDIKSLHKWDTNKNEESPNRLDWLPPCLMSKRPSHNKNQGKNSSSGALSLNDLVSPTQKKTNLSYEKVPKSRSSSASSCSFLNEGKKKNQMVMEEDDYESDNNFSMFSSNKKGRVNTHMKNLERKKKEIEKKVILSIFKPKTFCLSRELSGSKRIIEGEQKTKHKVSFKSIRNFEMSSSPFKNMDNTPKAEIERNSVPEAESPESTQKEEKKHKIVFGKGGTKSKMLKPFSESQKAFLKESAKRSPNLIMTHNYQEKRSKAVDLILLKRDQDKEKKKLTIRPPTITNLSGAHTKTMKENHGSSKAVHDLIFKKLQSKKGTKTSKKDEGVCLTSTTLNLDSSRSKKEEKHKGPGEIKGSKIYLEAQKKNLESKRVGVTLGKMKPEKNKGNKRQSEMKAECLFAEEKPNMNRSESQKYFFIKKRAANKSKEISKATSFTISKKKMGFSTQRFKEDSKGVSLKA